MAAEAAESTREARVQPPDGDDRPGPVARWAVADPIRAVAVVLMVAQLAWRAQIASRGFLAIDDFALASHAHESRLGPDYLFGLFNNHLMPGGLLLTWLITKWVGLAYWPYLLLMLAGQAAVDVALFRLLRRMLNAGWPILLPLALFLFNPLTLEASSWWAVGVNLLPMQLSMVLAISSHLSYLRTRRPRYLVGTALAVLFGLAFFEKALLIVPLLFLITACLYTRAGPVRSVWEPLRRYWPMWCCLAVVSAGYLALYLSQAQSSVRAPTSTGEMLTFLRQLFGSTVLPGLLGGPWWWFHAADGTPLTATHEIARWLAWAAVLVVTAVTVLVRRSAVRAWLLLYVYLGVVGGLIGSTRLGGTFSWAAGLVPRYVSDVVVVAAVCLGAALLGVAAPAPDEPDPRPLLAVLRPRRELLAGALVVALAGYLLSAGWTSARFGDEWARKQGRDFLRTALAEVAAAPEGTVFFDRPVSEEIITTLSAPYNMQSRFFEPVPDGPRFVTATGALSILDDAGHIHPGTVAGVKARPGPLPVYGYKLTGGQTRWIPLETTMFEWRWAVDIGYLAKGGDTTATFRFGNGEYRFPVQNGLHHYYFLVDGGGAFVQLTVDDPAVTFFTNGITIGNPVPGL
jgi:hypothetical protein